MTYSDAEQYIHSFTRFGSQLGLERMREFLHLLGDPQKALKFIHIAGTNGKGSTAKMAASILEQAGYVTGMYTSPFIVDFRERFQVNGKMIEKPEFAELVEWIDPAVKTLAQKGSGVTEFEAITAIGFEYFRRKHCDVVALEVGLGGRFDATNVIDPPECAVITAISLDHTDILGDTVEKIAFEKAGIIKPDTDVVTYPLQDLDAVGVFLERCAQTGSRLIQPNPNAVAVIESGPLGSAFRYGGQEYRLKLAGKHQVYNAVAVIEVMKVLQRKGLGIPEEAVREGLLGAVIPGRFEILGQNPLRVLDGAHNRQAVEALGQTLDKIDSAPKIAVMGMMADKDHESAVKSMGKRCEAIITVPVKGNPRALDPAKLAEEAGRYCPKAFCIPDYEEALKKAVGLAGKTGMVIVCGSFYLATDMRKVLKKMGSAQ